jgi:UDP-N-acetylglucosamine 4,6-dehydratase
VPEPGLHYLITGGTGSFGRAFVRRLLATDSRCTLRIFSRDELKQYEMEREFRADPRLRFFLGDVRDHRRLLRALDGADVVVHAAALKHVPLCEYNPAEAIKTNVMGALHLIDAAIDAGVSRVIALSTDKAVNPVNLYGATKLCAEKIFVHGNRYAGSRGTRFACVRYGNVVGSRGSVVPLFLEQAESGTLTLTDVRMTRFWLSLDQAVDFVLHSLDEMHGGEIFVPRIPSMRIVDLARAIAPRAMLKEVGCRPGEKLHEILLTAEEARQTVEYPTHFVIAGGPRRRDGAAPPDGFVYASDTNTQWLDGERLAELVADLGPAHGR